MLVLLQMSNDVNTEIIHHTTQPLQAQAHASPVKDAAGAEEITG